MIKRVILITILLAYAAYGVTYVVNGRDVNNRGGTWMVRKKASFTTTMATSNTAKAQDGTNLLSLNYYTHVLIDSARDSIYTLGLDSLSTYPDSAVSGTGWYIGGGGADTTCLYLDGFVDETIDVVFFFTGTAGCTSFVTVEQSFRFDTTLADSGFNYGFFVTDTLVMSKTTLAATRYDYNADGDSESVIVAAVSAAGAIARLYRDSFILVAPCLRIKILTSGLAGNAAIPLGIELYPRHNNTIMSGTSGRLIQQIPEPPKGLYQQLMDR